MNVQSQRATVCVEEALGGSGAAEQATRCRRTHPLLVFFPTFFPWCGLRVIVCLCNWCPRHNRMVGCVWVLNVEMQ